MSESPCLPSQGPSGWHDASQSFLSLSRGPRHVPGSPPSSTRPRGSWIRGGQGKVRASQCNGASPLFLLHRASPWWCRPLSKDGPASSPGRQQGAPLCLEFPNLSHQPHIPQSLDFDLEGGQGADCNSPVLIPSPLAPFPEPKKGCRPLYPTMWHITCMASCHDIELDSIELSQYLKRSFGEFRKPFCVSTKPSSGKHKSLPSTILILKGFP